jgi:hypothetical protein
LVFLSLGAFVVAEEGFFLEGLFFLMGLLLMEEEILVGLFSL